MISETEVLAGLAFLEAHAPASMRGAITVAKSACEIIQQDAKRNELRKATIDSLELSVRSAVALKHLGLETVGDVEEFVWLPDPEVLGRGKRAGLGKKCVKEVRQLMSNIGLGRREARPA